MRLLRAQLRINIVQVPAKRDTRHVFLHCVVQPIHEVNRPFGTAIRGRGDLRVMLHNPQGAPLAVGGVGGCLGRVIDG